MLGAILAVAVAVNPVVEVRTQLGVITAEVDVARAPVTACNFLRYVAAESYDGGVFHRSVRRDRPMGNPNPIDVIQAQTPAGDDDPGFGAIPLERTSATGLRHVTGALSMARNGPDTATSSFFVVVKDSPSLDFGGARNPDGQAFAVFGRVLSGMAVARAIQAAPVEAGTERLAPPVAVKNVRVVRGSAAACPPA